MPPSSLLEVLVNARQVASHAQRLGFEANVTSPRQAVDHVGAVLADSILQAGLNYRTVVWPRVQRIQASYPLTAKLSGVRAIVDCGQVADFLAWKHPVKLTRFSDLVALLDGDDVEEISDLREWLRHSRSRDRLLSVHGVGPKTYDYMCCMVGIDRIAVDRHVKSFASDAGVGFRGYDDLQAVVSCAADLLGLPRRDFDAWIWRLQSRELNQDHQLSLF